MVFNDIAPWGRPSNSNVSSNNNRPRSSRQNGVNQLFEGFGNNWLMPSFSSENRVGSPAIDILESDKDFKVEAELPGIRQEDIQADINDNYLTIKARKNEDSDSEGENYIRRERSFSSYERIIALPETADASKAKANFKRGVLWVEIPKKPEATAKSRKLEINKAA